MIKKHLKSSYRNNTKIGEYFLLTVKSIFGMEMRNILTVELSVLDGGLMEVKDTKKKRLLLIG